MSNPKLTDWFDPHVKPVHIGYFHTGAFDLDPRGREDRGSSYNWWWDGRYWLTDKDGNQLLDQNRYWRGLAEDPTVLNLLLQENGYPHLKEVEKC